MIKNNKFCSLADTPEEVLDELQRNGFLKAKYLAQEKDGTWFAFAKEPIKENDGWGIRIPEIGSEEEVDTFILEVFPNMLKKTKDWEKSLTFHEAVFTWDDYK